MNFARQVFLGITHSKIISYAKMKLTITEKLLVTKECVTSKRLWVFFEVTYSNVFGKLKILKLGSKKNILFENLAISFEIFHRDV